MNIPFQRTFPFFTLKIPTEYLYIANFITDIVFSGLTSTPSERQLGQYSPLDLNSA